MVKPFFNSISIQTRILLLFALQIFIMLTFGGVYLSWSFRKTLDAELSDKLKRLAQAAALQIDAELLSAISPGDEDTRTYNFLLTQLHAFKASTDVRRLYIIARDQRRLLDTEPNFAIGQPALFLPISRKEMMKVFSGQTVSSTLFEGADDKQYKAGFAPITHKGEAVAALAVDGSADTFEAIHDIQQALLYLAGVVLACAIALSVIFARTITRPIERLKQTAQKITSGDYESAINTSGQDEVGFLASTMEEMRKSIVRRDKQQKEMLAGVAHEIRNPLGGIELFSGLLVSELETGKAKDEALKIRREVQNLDRIVSDFLDYARPQRAQKRECTIRETFEEATMLLAAQLTEIRCNFTETEAETQAYVDPHHLKQILLNLLKNAAEALSAIKSNDKRIQISVSLENQDVLISIGDNGPGIPPQKRTEIFKPFFTTRASGSGLGLAIVKTLVEENSGKISLVENQTAGCEFQIVLQQTP